MRIVSLCPSLTELVFALGRGEDLVGITSYCVHPAEGVDAVEKVGGTKSPDVARIIDLAPDVVLLNDEENRLEDAKALQKAALSCVSSLPRNPAETAATVRSIGEALDRRRAAEGIARAIEERAEAVRVEASRRPSVRFAYIIWRQPLMSVNADTFAHSLLALAGGINVFADAPERYPTISSIQLRQARPDIVLLGSEPFPFADVHRHELASATGLELHRYRLVDGEYLSWHGSRTVEGLGYAAGIMAEVAQNLDST